MFRFASHRLSEIIAISIASLAMCCAHHAQTGDVHAEEMAPLAAIDELVKHKGLELAANSLCAEFAVGGSFDRKEYKEFAKQYTIVGVSVDPVDLAKVDPSYPRDYDASFVTLVDRRPPLKPGDISDLVLRMTSVLACRTSRQNIPGYAFSFYVDGRISKAAVGDKVGNVYSWSDVDLTAEMQDIFSIELQLWSSAAMRHFVEELPNKR